MADKEYITDIGKFYNLIKKKVKFNGNECDANCNFIYYDAFEPVECIMFNKVVDEKAMLSNFKRCRQCKTYFGK
jgi:hypothetical protein